MTKPNWKLEEDGLTVTVTFPTNPPVVLKLGAADVDSLLHGLGGLRHQMQPAPPAQFASGQQFVAAPYPAWSTEIDATHGNSVLHLRDPRFGWLHYMLSKEEAGRLSTALAIQADAPMTFQPPKPN
jgi:hypothetical protein